MPAESKGEAPGPRTAAGRRVLVVGGGQMDIGEADTPIGNGRAISVLLRAKAPVAVADRDAASAEATVAMIEAERGRTPSPSRPM